MGRWSESVRSVDGKLQADEMLAKARASTEEYYKKIELELKRKMFETAASMLTQALSEKSWPFCMNI